MHANHQAFTPRQVGEPAARSIDLVVIHASGTPSGKPLHLGQPGARDYLHAPKVINARDAARGCSRKLAAVRAFSSQLPSIGFHYVIDLSGEVWSGRALTEVGEHALNFDAHSVGICLVGGEGQEAQYTAKQWESLRAVVSMLLMDCGIPCTGPKRVPCATSLLGFTRVGGVCGFRDLQPNALGDVWEDPNPGFDVRAWLARGMTPLAEQVCEAAQ